MKRVIAVIVILMIMSNTLQLLANEPDQLSVLQADISSISAKIVANNNAVENYETQLRTKQNELSSLNEQLAKTKIDNVNAQTAYDRAYQNPDLFNDETNNQLRRDLNTSKSSLNQISNAVSKLNAEIDKLNNDIQALKNQNSEYQKRLTNDRAEMFDIQFKSPKWVEGYGESIMDEDATVKVCMQQARDYALHDATEKAGAAVLEATTIVGMNRITKDEIKTTMQVQTLQEDTSNGYGTAKKVAYGDYGKFVCTVRIQVENTSKYNPYREGENVPNAGANGTNLAIATGGSSAAVAAIMANQPQAVSVQSLIATPTTLSGKNQSAAIDPNIQSNGNQPINFNNNSQQSLNGAYDQLLNHYINYYKESGPGWLQRTQVGVSYFSTSNFTANISTMQPLYMSDDWSHSLFIQGNYNYSGATTGNSFTEANSATNTINVGAGYRTMLSDWSMLGLNGFYDYQLSTGHARVGGGAELFAGSLEFRGNYYQGISNPVQVGTEGYWNIMQQAANGYDYSIGTNLSLISMPWLSVYGQGYSWTGQHPDTNTWGGDLSGYGVKLDLQVTPQLQLEYGQDLKQNSSYGKFNFNLLALPQPAMLWGDSEINSGASKNISYKMQQPVQRNNTIVVEQYKVRQTGTVNVVISDNTGAALIGVSTTLSGSGQATAAVGATGYSQTVTTDSNGTARYSGVPLGNTYSAQANITGYAPNPVTIKPTQSGQSVVSSTNPTTPKDITLTIVDAFTGNPISGAAVAIPNIVKAIPLSDSFGKIIISNVPKLATEAGTVTKSGYSAGAIPALDGATTNATVTMSTPSSGTIIGTISGTTVTDDIIVNVDGSAAPLAWNGTTYTISNVVAGTHTIAISKTNYAVTPATQNVTVPAGGTVTATAIVFSANLGSITGTITGTTVTSDVTAMIDGTNATLAWNGTTYTISGVAAGSHTIVIGKTNYAATPTTQNVTVPAGGSVTASSVLFSANPGTITGTINGTTVTSDITATVDGSPAALVWNGTTYETGYTRSITSGTHTLVISKPNCTATPTTQNVTVPAGGTATATAVAFNTGTIVGCVRTMTNIMDIDTSDITATVDGSAAILVWSGLDWNGKDYTITNVAAGTHTLVISKPNCTATPATQNATIPEDGEFYATLVAFSANPGSITGTITGTTVTSDVTAMIDGTNATLAWNGTTYTISGVAAGSHTIVIGKTNYAATPTTQNVTVPAGGSVTASSVLFSANPGTITGTINGTTVTSDVTATIDGTNANLFWNGTTYTISNVAAGTHTVAISKPNYTATPATQNVTVTAGGTVTATAIAFIANPGRITGTITGTTATSDITATVDGSAAALVWNGTTYSISNVVAGSHTIAISKAHYAATPATQNLTVPAGGIVTVNAVTFTANTGTITGAIGLIGGSYTGDITAAVDGSIVPLVWNGTDYIISNVSAETHTVVISKPNYTATPSTQNVTVAAGGTVNATYVSLLFTGNP